MTERSRLNILIVQTLIFSLLVALFGRVFYLQVIDSERYQTAALSIQSRDVVTPAVRGAIVDSSGIPLALDRPGLFITANRNELDKLPDKGIAVLKRVSATLNLTYSTIYAKTRLCGELPLGKRAGCWNGTRYQPIPLTKEATAQEALKVLENSDLFPGISAAAVPVRGYPSLAGENAAHVLGYVGPVTQDDLNKNPDLYYQNETLGKAGLELQYDKYLHGTPGVKTFIVDRKESVTQESQNTQAIPGNNLVTNLDARLQAITEKALADAVRRSRSLGHRADSAGAIVLDVKTGAVLALASYPTYDPNIWERGLTVQQAKDLYAQNTGVPALTRPIQAMFAPASTFKSLSVVSAARAGYNLNAYYTCPSKVKIGNRDFKNFESKSQGTITMKQAIAVSCDTIWYQIAYDEWVRDGGLSPKSNAHDYFFSTAQQFGVGRVTGIDLPDEATGRLPNREWKNKWYQANKDFFCNYTTKARKSELTPYLIAIAKENCTDGYIVRAGDAVNFAIGQGDVLVTPVQLATMYAAIANGGTLYKPEVARAVVSPTGKVIAEYKPQVTGKIPTNSTILGILHDALRMVVTKGTAADTFAGFPIAISGKTGTAQVFGKNGDGSSLDDTSWFASYGPSESPQYAVVMVVSQGGFGASVSAVGVRQIYEGIFGVKGSKVIPGLELFPNGLPTSIPKIDVKNATLPKLAPLPAPSTTPTAKKKG